METIETDIKNGLEFIKNFNSDNGDIILDIEGEHGYGTSISLVMESNLTFGVQQEYKKLIKSAERLVRSSSEYKIWLSNLRGGCNLNKCSFFPNIETDGVEIEFHHTPLTLYDIVEVILTHLIFNDIPITSTLLADLTIDEHLSGHIGLMPVTVTAHKLIHNDLLYENYKMIHGNWISFLLRFRDGVSNIHISKCYDVMSRSDDFIYQKALETLGVELPKYTPYCVPVYESEYSVFIREQLRDLSLNAGTK